MIVDACSDALPGNGQEKPPWLKRKRDYIAHLRSAGASTMLVSAADKLHNLRAIYADSLRIQEKIWARFSAPEPKRLHTLWYYCSLNEIYASAASPHDPRRTGISAALTDLLNRFGYRAGEFEPGAQDGSSTE